MKEIDYRDLDGHVLRTFLTVLEEASVSRAAERLNVTQSSVSHTLSKLRVVFGDPLFVRSGIGIDATERARALREPIQAVLDDLKGLTDERAFDPTAGTLRFTIAANELQRDLIFPTLLRKARAEAVDLRLTFLPSGIPDAAILRDARCHLILTPHPPDEPDIYQQRLFRGQLLCFYDGSYRDAPGTWDEFRDADRIEVRFGNLRTTPQIMNSARFDQLKEPVVYVPNFSAISAFLRGSELVVMETSLMRLGPLKDFDCTPLPFHNPPVTISTVWHQRDNNDPAHKWLRGQIKDYADALIHEHDELEAP